MKKTVLAALIAAVSLSAFAAAKTERGAHSESLPMHGVHGMKMHGDGNGLPRSFAKLNLSDAQKQKIRAIVEANRPSEADRAAMKQARSERAHPDFNAPFDEAAARKEIAERQQRHAEMELKHRKMQHEIMQVLTAEQRKQLAEQGRRKMNKGKKPNDKAGEMR